MTTEYRCAGGQWWRVEVRPPSEGGEIWTPVPTIQKAKPSEPMRAFHDVNWESHVAWLVQVEDIAAEPLPLRAEFDAGLIVFNDYASLLMCWLETLPYVDDAALALLQAQQPRTGGDWILEAARSERYHGQGGLVHCNKETRNNA